MTSDQRDETTAQEKEYRPELLPRRGEWIAWLLALVVAITWLILFLLAPRVTILAPLLTIAFILAACSISLGNWIDRHTLISVNDRGISFRNGLRNIVLEWDKICEVRILPAIWGKKIQVFGVKTYFDFRTLGEVKYKGEVKGRTGIVKGEELLRTIIIKSGLQIVDRLGEGYYYARK